jgi:hypothetical protein
VDFEGVGGSRGGSSGGGVSTWVGDLQLLSNLGVEEYRPRVLKDFELFLNIVEFTVWCRP